MCKKKKGQWVVIRVDDRPKGAELCYFDSKYKRMSEEQADSLVKEMSNMYPHYLYEKACLK